MQKREHSFLAIPPQIHDQPDTTWEAHFHISILKYIQIQFKQ